MGFGDKTVIIGVTGVIGSGKSTFCRFLRDKLGFVYIDADKVVHELYAYRQPGCEIIKKHFGVRFVGKNGVDREKLRKFLVKNPDKIRTLNRLTHPLVTREVSKKVVQAARVGKGKRQILVCVEAVYFDKKNLGKFVDKIITVDAPDEVILERLRGRGRPKKELKALLGYQREFISRLHL